MALNILILEDDTIQRLYYKEIIQKRILINPSPKSYDMRIAVSSDQPQDILNYIKINPHDSILALLDIDLNKNISGINVAELIRQKCSSADICFITSYSDLLLPIINKNLAPLDFIIKNQSEELITNQLRNIVDLAFSRYKKEITNSKDVSLFTYEPAPGIYHQIPTKNILYIQTSIQKHRLILVQRNSEIEFRGELKDLDRHKNFLRADRQVIVNLSNIAKIDIKARKIYFSHSNKSCKISVRKVPLFKKRILNKVSSNMKSNKQ